MILTKLIHHVNDMMAVALKNFWWSSFVIIRLHFSTATYAINHYGLCLTAIGQIYVGLTNTRPDLRHPPSLNDSEYSLCADHPDIPFNTTEHLVCGERGVRGRYLFVVNPGRKHNLLLCELEAYAPYASCRMCLSNGIISSLFFC